MTCFRVLEDAVTRGNQHLQVIFAESLLLDEESQVYCREKSPVACQRQPAARHARSVLIWTVPDTVGRLLDISTLYLYVQVSSTYPPWLIR